MSSGKQIASGVFHLLNIFWSAILALAFLVLGTMLVSIFSLGQADLTEMPEFKIMGILIVAMIIYNLIMTIAMFAKSKNKILYVFDIVIHLGILGFGIFTLGIGVIWTFILPLICVIFSIIGLVQKDAPTTIQEINKNDNTANNTEQTTAPQQEQVSQPVEQTTVVTEQDKNDKV